MIRSFLKESGIESRPGFTPFSKLRYLDGKAKFMTGYPVSDQLYKKVISLPTYPGLCKKEIREIALTLKKGLAKFAS